MTQSTENYGVHCNACDFEGQAKTNSSTAFIVFFVMLCCSVFFLPLIIVALVYMGWFIAQPGKKKCPKCGSEDLTALTLEQALAANEKLSDASSSQK